MACKNFGGNSCVYVSGAIHPMPVQLVGITLSLCSLQALAVMFAIGHTADGLVAVVQALLSHL